MAAVTDRRALLTALAAAPLAAGLGLAAAPASAQAADVPRLGALAAAKGLFYGAALTSAQLQIPPELGRLLLDQADVWVAEWQMKWGPIEYDGPGLRNYKVVDAIADAAAAHGKRLRGHTLLWHTQMPPWAKNGRIAETRAAWDKQVAPFIADYAGRYAGRVFQWDVVNEVIEPDDGLPGALRNSPYYRMTKGSDYIDQAFHLAREAAPDAKLYINDYGLEYPVAWNERRRVALLKLLESLLARGVPVEGVGIQSHLDIAYGFDAAVFGRFLDAIADLGLEITLTELDVREGVDNPNPLAQRYQRAADEVRAYLETALDRPAVKGVLTWGLCDPFSYMRLGLDIADNRGLPFDDAFRPTPMHETLAALFAGASPRST